MELEHARALLAELADGVDPLTGECLPSDSVCNRRRSSARCTACCSTQPAGESARRRPMRASRGRRRTTAPCCRCMTRAAMWGSSRRIFSAPAPRSYGAWSGSAGCSPGNCSDEKHPARGESREPGALTMGSFENGARFARLRPGAAYIEVLQLLERVVRAEFAVDEAMYNAPIPTVILNVAAQRFKHFRLHLAPSFLSAAQRAR